MFGTTRVGVCSPSKAVMPMRTRLALLLALLALSCGFSLQGKTVSLHHSSAKPHILRLTWGTTLIKAWWVPCVPNSPHITRVWTIVRIDFAEMWYCGGLHVSHWYF